MKFPLFNLKRGGAILAFVSCGCLGGILPAAELRPLAEEESKTQILQPSKPAVIETNRSSVPVSRARVPVKPNEVNLRDLIDGGQAPLPVAPRMPTTSDRKDDDLLNQENAWGN